MWKWKVMNIVKLFSCFFKKFECMIGRIIVYENVFKMGVMSYFGFNFFDFC